MNDINKTEHEENVIIKPVRIGSNRYIYVIDGRINYLYETAGVVAYCTYNDLLFEILQDERLSPSMSSHVPGKIQLRKHSAVEIKGYCTLAELCAACYYEKISSIEKWQHELAVFRRWMRNLGFEIDHADSNQLNCTVYNLSIMSAATNKWKQAVTANIKQPQIAYCGRYGNVYRIQIIWPGLKHRDGKHGIRLNIWCETPKDFTACLREIYSLGDGYGKPLYSSDPARCKDRLCVTTEDVGQSIAGQEMLASMDKCCFQKYKRGQIARMFLDSAYKMDTLQI